MKKNNKYRNNNNNYNNQIYSLNYKFDSISAAGKFSGTALDLIKRYNELAKESQGNGNYVEAEVFRQYAEHYRKIVTEINEKKNQRFNRENETAAETSAPAAAENIGNTVEETPAPVQAAPAPETVAETPAPEAPQPKVKREFKVIEISAEASQSNSEASPATAETKTPKPRGRRKSAAAAG